MKNNCAKCIKCEDEHHRQCQKLTDYIEANTEGDTKEERQRFLLTHVFTFLTGCAEQCSEYGYDPNWLDEKEESEWEEAKESARTSVARPWREVFAEYECDGKCSVDHGLGKGPIKCKVYETCSIRHNHKIITRTISEWVIQIAPHYDKNLDVLALQISHALRDQKDNQIRREAVTNMIIEQGDERAELNFIIGEARAIILALIPSGPPISHEVATESAEEWLEKTSRIRPTEVNKERELLKKVWEIFDNDRWKPDNAGAEWITNAAQILYDIREHLKEDPKQEEEYYIICLERASHEYSLLFWKSGGAGYTSNFDEAGTFDKEMAQSTNTMGRDIALSKDELADLNPTKHTLIRYHLTDLKELKKELKEPKKVEIKIMLQELIEDIDKINMEEALKETVYGEIKDHPTVKEWLKSNSEAELKKVFDIEWGSELQRYEDTKPKGRKNR